MNRPTYNVLQLRQTWRLHNGEWMREAIARRSDGQLRLILVRDDDPAVAA